MANTKDTAATDPGPESVEDLKAQLEAVKNEAAQARREAEAAKAAKDKAEAQLAEAGGPVQVTGSYQGFTFAKGQKLVRDRTGKLCDAQKIMDAANAGDAFATDLLDWLISSGYALLVPAEA